MIQFHDSVARHGSGMVSFFIRESKAQLEKEGLCINVTFKIHIFRVKIQQKSSFYQFSSAVLLNN